MGAGELAYLAKARLFSTNGTSLCASPSRESTLAALERARKSDCTVVFDVDYRAMSWSSAEQAGQPGGWYCFNLAFRY